MGGGSSKHINVIALGLDGAGKTALLYRMKLKGKGNEFSTTTGFNYEEIDVPNSRCLLHVWDLAGGPDLRRFWRFFYEAIMVDVFLFVVNLDQKERLGEAAKLFRMLRNEERLRKSFKVVILNADDEKPASGRASPDDVATQLGIDSNSPHELVMPVNCITGIGLDELFLAVEKYY